MLALAMAAVGIVAIVDTAAPVSVAPGQYVGAGLLALRAPPVRGRGAAQGTDGVKLYARAVAG